jgi:acetyl esterase/lipase
MNRILCSGFVAIVGWMSFISITHAAIPPGVMQLKDLAYVPDGTSAQKLDLYLPEKASDAKRPLIIYIHGGGWGGGNKSGVPVLWLIDRGYSVASLEYRFSKVALFPAQTQDCQAAVRWLRAHADQYHLDGDRFGVVGDSAGGHLSLMVGMTGGKNVFPKIGGNDDQSYRVQAVCDFYGPADFNTVVDQFAHSDTPSNYHFDGSDPYSHLIGVIVGTDRAKGDVASPAHYVTADVAPVLLMHGTKDPLVPFAQSEELYAALKAAQVDALLQHYPNAGHGGRVFQTAATRGLILAFFDRHVRGKEVNVELLPDSLVTAPSPTSSATKPTTGSHP